MELYKSGNFGQDMSFVGQRYTSDLRGMFRTIVRIRSVIFVVLLAALCGALSLFAESPVSPDEVRYDGTADPAAMVEIGHVRFTVLTPQLIRMEWSANAVFEDRPSLVFLNRRLPVPKFEQHIENGVLTIRTSDLELTYKIAAPGRFSAENLQVKLSLPSRDIAWHPGDAPTGNLLGTTRTLDGARGDKTLEPIEPGLLSRDGWTVVDDSTRPLFDSDDFSFSNGETSPWPWVLQRPAGDRQDLYFFGYGHAYKQALGDFIKVAGRIPLPPRFAFGTWWSRYWAYSDQEVNELVQGFHQNDTPLDVVVIDMDWHKTAANLKGESDQSGHVLGWSGTTWNPLLFPHPSEFLDQLHREGLKVTLNLHPASGIQPWEDAYPAMANAMGIDPKTRRYVPFNLTDKKFATASMQFVYHPLEQQGVDFWWLDWQQENSTQVANLNPTWWLNYVFFTDQQREDKRPLLFHRWGGLGNHRYQIGFSGDTISVWESLAFQPWFTATAANVGYAYWSHDIGGHMPGAVDPELYTRWLQFGALSPILRTHTTKNPDAERRIWAYPEPYSNIMRETYKLRYALEPYIYTEARRTYDTGVAFLHPLYYEWPEEDAAYTNRGEYIFGQSLLVAPVVKPVDTATGLAAQSIWIPPGEWIEVATGTHLHGPAMVERNFSIDQIPMYVRTGAIIPMQPPMQYTGQQPVAPFTATIYPLSDKQTSTYTLYEDGNRSEDYQHGICSWTPITAKQNGDDLTVEFGSVRGSFPGMAQQRKLRVVLPTDWPPESVSVNGKPVGLVDQESAEGWHYEGNTLSTIITTSAFPSNINVTFAIHRRAGSLSDRGLLDGFAGSITRLRASYDLLNAAWPATPPGMLIDTLQTGDRIGYRPVTAQSELTDFAKKYRETQLAIAGLQAKASLSDEQLIIALGPRKDQTQNATAIARFRTAVQRSASLLSDGAALPSDHDSGGQIVMPF